VEEAANKCGDGTSKVMAAASMCQDFTTDLVFLVLGEFELGTGGAVQGVEGAGCDVQDDVADAELDIATAERSGVRRKTIFARAKEVERTKVRHVGRGTTKGVTNEYGSTVDFV
jgi:hypothetical protein